MKTILRWITALSLLGGLSGCTDKNKIYEGVYRGMYDGATQMQELKNPDPTPPPRKESLSYDQYKREREEILNEQEK